VPDDLDEFARRLDRPEYPRSSTYDPAWLLENMMGPHPLWLAESLSGLVPFAPGDRVLDLGCGTALTSVFLAREFDVRVEAVDLWIDAAENLDRVTRAGLADRVHPVHADAMALPFDAASFDTIVSVDAYHYFGTAPGALDTVVRVLKPGGRIAVAVPGLAREVTWPDALGPWWEPGFETFHSAHWWASLWRSSATVRIDHADAVPDGHRDWLAWGEIADDWAVARGREPYRREVEMLRADTDRLLGVVSLVATKT